MISISKESTDDFESRIGGDPRFGADFRFLGAVRDVEDGRKISGIDYSCYEPMAREMLQKICDEMMAEEPDHEVLIHHRIGFVAAGVPSIVIRVLTRHSQPGFELCREYLKRIKKTVPIWKKPVFVGET
ncbi:MAG: molybdopterin synthase catalytic subunit [Verrucomicrobiales bacterium]|jgi:molybdopterin synthase catalytic subunit